MIETIYEELKKLGAVSSKTDFSEEWLGMEGSYFRGRRGKDGSASSKALATCAVRLRRRASILQGSAFPQARVAAGRFELLADQCLEGLLAACDGQDNGYARR